MQRWFLSYHSPDQALAERLKTAIEHADSKSRVFFAPTHLRAGGSWSAQLAQEITEATAFILLIGEAGIGKWQVPEYDEALDKWVNSGRTFPLIVLLLEGQTAPGLHFLRQLHWIITRRSATGMNARPASVCATLRVPRVKSFTPNRTSACWMMRLTPGWDMRRYDAAAMKLPNLASVTTV